MSPQDRPGSAFDDRVALEELERLHRSIEEYRNQRKQAEAEFDSFVRSFRDASSEPPAAVPVEPPGPIARHEAPQYSTAAAAEPFFPSEPESQPVRPAAFNPPFPDYERPQPVVPPPRAAARSDTRTAKPRRPPALRPTIVYAGLAVLALAGFVLVRSWRAAPSGSSAQVTATPAARATSRSVPGPAAPAPSAAPASDASAPRAELMAVRRVWVRVVVDGDVNVQRELRPNDRVPLRNGRTIVIRTGDAGAIRVAIDGKDQGPLGRDGEVVTRTFTAPAR
jgi:hypothetical protein